MIVKHNAEMIHHSLVDPVFTVNEKQCPGKDSSQKIGGYIFDYLNPLIHCCFIWL